MSIFARAIYSGVPLRALAVFLCMCGLFGVVGSVHATTTIELPIALYEPQTWTLSESPYVITGEGFLDVQSDLIIEPGVTVFLSSSTSVFIRDGGSLTTSGTEETPVIFTGNGDECTDEERWGGLYFDAPYTVSHITHTGFYCGSVFTGDVGHYEIDWSNPADIDSFYVVWVPNIITRESFIDVSSGDVTIDHTSFYDLTGAALYNTSWYALNAQENWWGDASGPSVGSNPTGTGYAISDNVLYDPWIGQDDVVVPVVTSTPTTTARNPVIFIPGIMGTEFVRRVSGEEDELIWLDPLRTLLSYGDNFMLNLALDMAGIPLFSEIIPSSTLRIKTSPIGERVLFDYTDHLIRELNDIGYTENENLFLFPYDWRMSNSTTAQLLSARIVEVLNETHATKVDIIAHSMGGLVAKKYINTHPEDRSIDKLIFLGTPHLGSTDAIQNLLFGSDLGIKLREYSLLTSARVKEISRNMPSVYELTPTEQYVNLFGPVLSDLVQRKNYTHSETQSFLRDNNLNSNFINSAISFHNNLDTMVIPQNIDAYSVQGCGVPTTRRLVKQAPKFGEDEWLLYIGDGDGTVPLGSASYVGIPESHKVTIPGLIHSEMPSDRLVQPILRDILLGNTSTASSFSHPDECGINGTLISVHSPVALSATNGQGQFVGVSTTGDIEYTIPGSRYDQLGENKFIFLPTSEGGEAYQVHLLGTATGTFNARVTTIVDGSPEETRLFLDIPVTNQSTGSISVSSVSTNAPTLIYDKEGDGTFLSLSSDAITTDEDTVDITSPTTTLLVHGQRGQGQWYVGTTTVSFVPQDMESGVLRTMYSLDSGMSWVVYSEPIVLRLDGRYPIQYYSIDKMGNREGVREATILLDRTPPEAEFYFNQQLQDVSVVGRDTMSTTTVSTTPTMYTIRDEAGNTLQLVFDEINRPIIKRASLNRLVYNGRVVLPNARLTSFVWLTSTRNEVISLQQALRYNLDEGLYALYTKLGGRTFIRERTSWNSFTDRYENGMRIFRFTTNYGLINYR